MELYFTSSCTSTVYSRENFNFTGTFAFTCRVFFKCLYSILTLMFSEVSVQYTYTMFSLCLYSILAHIFSEVSVQYTYTIFSEVSVQYTCTYIFLVSVQCTYTMFSEVSVQYTCTYIFRSVCTVYLHVYFPKCLYSVPTLCFPKCLYSILAHMFSKVSVQYTYTMFFELSVQYTNTYLCLLFSNFVFPSSLTSVLLNSQWLPHEIGLSSNRFMFYRFFS